MELRALRGLPVGGAGKTFTDACDAYLSRPEPIGGTQWALVERLKREIGPVPLDLVTEATAQEWAHRFLNGRTQGTVRRALTAFNAVMARAATLGWTEKKVAAKRPGEGDGRTRWLTEEELQALLLHMPEHVWPFFTFMSQTGARGVELVALDWKDIIVTADGGLAVVLKHRKGNARKIHRRQVPLNKRALDALKEQARLNGQASVSLAKRVGPVFRNTYGERWASPASVSGYVEKAAKDAGLEDVRMHDLRRTFASTLVQRGVCLKAVAELLGHADLTMVQRYAHLSPSQHVAAVNKL